LRWWRDKFSGKIKVPRTKIILELAQSFIGRYWLVAAKAQIYKYFYLKLQRGFGTFQQARHCSPDAPLWALRGHNVQVH
jgi:hypothetical protein